MPELLDIALYIEALRQRVHGRPLERSKLSSAVLLCSVEPQLANAHGAQVAADELERLKP